MPKNTFISAEVQFTLFPVSFTLCMLVLSEKGVVNIITKLLLFEMVNSIGPL